MMYFLQRKLTSMRVAMEQTAKEGKRKQVRKFLMRS